MGSRIDPAGYDAAKKIKGRKRHIAVDTQGLILAQTVHPAEIQDRHGALLVLKLIGGKGEQLACIWL